MKYVTHHSKYNKKNASPLIYTKNNVNLEETSVNELLTVNADSSHNNILYNYSDYPRVTLGFRVRTAVYEKYMRLPRSLKRFIRDVIESMILNIDRAEVKSNERQVIVHMPIALALQKTEVIHESSDDALLKQLKRLKRKLKEYDELIKEYDEEISRLKSELRTKDKQIKELKARLKELSTESVRAKVETEVTRRFKSVLYELVKKGLLSKEHLGIIFKAMGW